MSAELGLLPARGFPQNTRWPLVRLGDVAELHYGKGLPERIRTPGEIRVFGSNGQCGWHNVSLGAGPTVVLGRKGQGPLGVEWCPWPFWVIDTAYYVSTDARHIELRFFYFLTKFVGLNHLKDGTSNPSLSRDVFLRQGIPLPPLPVQRRVVAMLSAYEDLIENSERRIRVLDEMARALYREWFVLFRYPGHEKVPLADSQLGPIPQGWVAGRVGEAAGFLSRGLSPTYDEEGGSLVINQKCIRDQRCDLSLARRQSKVVPDEKQVCAGDVLINSTGVGTLGRVAQLLVDVERCTVDTHVTIARPAAGVDRSFFGLALLAEQTTFERKGVGATGQTELSRSAIGDVPLVLPPGRLQREFGRLVQPMRDSTAVLHQRVRNLRTTRDLLLPRLLSGALSVEAAE